MDYIGLLTKEEKSTLCEIITGKDFRELFKRNEQDFSKIQKGFRAKSLTDQHALSIAINNVDKPFISMWVNIRVERWLKEIQENIDRLEGEGLSHSAAVAATMLDSFFVDHVDLYFKLTGNPLDVKACANLYDRMEDIKTERAKDSETANRIKALEEENHHLSDQVEAAQHSIDFIKAECEEKIQKIEQDKSQLSSLLAEAQAKITELQTVPNSFESDDENYLAEFDDTDTSILPPTGTDEVVSLCSVISDYNSQKWLIRYADLNNDGHYYIFHRNEDVPPYFTNREKIFYKDGPSKDDFYGVWTWSAVPNENDPSKDYILSRYTPEIEAIEVVIFTEETSINELIDLLKEGINYQPHSRRTMFAIDTSKGQYIGILCTAKELNTVNEKTSISEDCIVVPVYEFADDNMIHLDNGLIFYRNAFAGLPSKLYHLKGRLDIVKDIVFSSISWNAYKARDIIRAEYRTFKDFIGAIPVDNITNKIGVTCRCSNPVAKELLNQFLNIVWKYIDGDSIEDEIIRSAISANTELQEKTKALIRKDWETENEGVLAEAHRKLDSLYSELKTATHNLCEMQDAFSKTKAENERISGIIAEKEKLAEDVERAVSERIQRARENAADFIANMAFVGVQQTGVQQTQPTGVTTSPSINTTFDLDAASYCVYPGSENLDDLEVHHSWEDVINTTIYELSEAGVAEQYRSGLAAFLCAAYIEKQPLLLVGPNAIDIAQAFSASVTAHKYGMLCCESSYTRQAVEKIGNDGEDIVIINNLLTSGWMNRLPEILAKKKILYIATHPYAEDIQVEPKSLYGFMLPLFTEFFVDKKATGTYFGGYFSDDFKAYSAAKGTHRELAVLSKFELSSLVRNQINNLVTTMHNIYPAATVDDDFLFGIFPIAYASMAMNELSEAIADPQKGIAISANLKRDLQYVLGET